MFSISNYKPPGPIAAAFIRAPPGFVRKERVDGVEKAIITGAIAQFIKGPVGSGKTNATIFKILRTIAMLPANKHGVIQAKLGTVRADYRTLYATTLPTWWRWFPKDYPGSEWIGGADRPGSHLVRFITPRGRKIELHAEFKALGKDRIEDIMRGWEGTIGWLNEADLMTREAIEFMLQRIPRWPPKRELEFDASLPTLVVGDLNPPGDPDNWVEQDFVTGQPARDDGSPAQVGPKQGYKIFEQPSGLSADAENVQNLPDGYYERLAQTMEPWNVQRFVHGKTGYDRSGMPVFPEFDARLNLSRGRLKPIPAVPIWLGLDGALHPAGVIVQRAPNLQVRVLEEFYFGRCGPTRFGEMLAAALNDRYRECPVARGFYDPSSDYGADKEGGEQSWIDIVSKALGVALIAAPSNEVPLRVEAVRNMIVLPIAPEVRGLVVDAAACPMLVKGFMSHYRYKLNPDGRVQNPQAPRPEKNEFANPQDALQYVILGMVGRAGAIASAAKGYRPGGLGGFSQNAVMKTEFSL